MHHIPLRTLALSAALLLGPAWALAKLPPLSDEAKAKAAETAAKTAHGNKLANYQLCKSMDQVAGAYHANGKKTGKATPAAVATPACEDPGPFVYTPPTPAAPATAAAPAAAGTAVAAAPAATVAPAAAPAKK